MIFVTAPIHAPRAAPIVGRAFRDDIAVVSSHYNFANFRAPRRNLHRWQRQMTRDRLRTFGIELYQKGQTPQTTGWAGWRQILVGPASVVWQKEALINAAVRDLPAAVKNFVEVDADLMFDDPNWAGATLDMLKRHPCGQPFASAVWTGSEGEIELERPSACAGGFKLNPWAGHPGFSWAFRREFFESVGGWYDFGILGGADLLWANAALGGDDPADAARRIGLGDDPAYAVYHANVRRALGNTTPGFAPGIVFHEYHGSRHDRGYNERAETLKHLDPSKHLRHRPDGPLEWTKAAPRALRERVAAYFASRKEDDL